MRLFLIILLITGFGDKLHSQNSDSIIFITPEIGAEFPGGQEALMEFVEENLKYPKKNMCAEGKVYVSFNVNKDGSISEEKVVRGISKAMDSEALRVVSLMPKWNPGTMYGKPVKMGYVLPISFKLK